MIRTALMSATFICASLLTAPAMAADGTVEFRFTGFRGLFAGGSGVYGRSTVNGEYPIRTGIVGVDGRGYSWGTLDLTTGPTPVTSVTLQMPSDAGLPPFPEALANVVSFTARDFAGIAAGEEFVLGTISYTNGNWWGASPNPDQVAPTYLDFEIRTTSGTAEFNQVITGAIVLKSQSAIEKASECNLATGVPRAEADTLSIESGANVGTDPKFFVYDDFCKPAGSSNTGQVDLVGKFGSLDLVGFSNATGGGFLAESAVPEPATWAMMIVGFGVAGAALRRHGKAYSGRMRAIVA